MEGWMDVDQLDVLSFARSIELDCQEGVKWERRKLDWMRSEEQLVPAAEKQAA
jgi:hypothetical protein